MVLPEVTLSRRDGALYCTVVRSIAPNADVDREAASFTDRLDGVERIAAETARGPGRWRAAEAGAAGSEALESLFAEAGAEYHVSADRSHAAYRAQISQALEAIARGDFEKVVVARSLEVQHRGRFALRRFLDELRQLYPSCTVFCVGRGSDSLIAASPEHLVSLDGETVEVAALAGSAPRGRTPEHDDALGRALRESKKDQAEHETVVRAVRAALADVCEALDGPETPRLLRLEGIQHLHTPLRGVLRGVRLHDERLRVLDLVARLHPTPAVGGLPRRPALAWLEQHERLQRGWYAAPVGFVDATGGGEFWLALRAALVREAPPAREAAGAGEPAMSHARLYAGAGIVQGSVPELELAETRLKLRALLAPLTEI
jgi:isochorismate synthase